jgi:hypothetical protein
VLDSARETNKIRKSCNVIRFEIKTDNPFFRIIGLKKSNAQLERINTFKDTGISGFTSLLIVMLSVKARQFNKIKIIAFFLLIT